MLDSRSLRSASEVNQIWSDIVRCDGYLDSKLLLRIKMDRLETMNLKHQQEEEKKLVKLLKFKMDKMKRIIASRTPKRLVKRTGKTIRKL